MIGELSILSEWIPEQMEPGTIFVLENAGDVGDKDDPYWAVLSCPNCGQLGLVTRKQVAGLIPVICGSDKSGHTGTAGCRHPVTPRIAAHTSQPIQRLDSRARIPTVRRVTHL